MRPALLCLLLAALSWPALAWQDQSQTSPAQSPTTATPPATTPPPPSQAPAQPSTPAGTQQAPKTEAPPSSAKTPKKKAPKKKKSAKKKSVAKHKKPARKKSPETTADAGPKRIVVRRGGTSDTGGQLEPGVPRPEANHQRQATEQMLQSTDASLKKIADRKLTPDQQDMVRQITFYMQQSRSANEEGDLGRARNLAVKARQLCDALTRQ
ncbi:MAG: hypothetical protein ACM3PW_06285 [Chlamydiota bacterium]